MWTFSYLYHTTNVVVWYVVWYYNKSQELYYFIGIVSLHHAILSLLHSAQCVIYYFVH